MTTLRRYIDIVENIGGDREKLSETVYRVYHGTGVKFDAFVDHFLKPNYFTPDIEYAKGYTGKTSNILHSKKRGKNYLLTVDVTINNIFDTKTDVEARRYYNEVFVPYMSELHARYNQPPLMPLLANKWVSFVYADDFWRFVRSEDVPWDGMLVDEGFGDHPAIVPFRASQIRIIKRQIVKESSE